MYAEVILSKVTPQLDRIYHYRVPDELKDKIKIGHQVTIPFGKSVTVGYVVGFVEKPDVSASLVRDIIDLKSDTPLFKPEALKLARWMTDYYGCFFISALRTIMPPGTAGKEKRKKEVISDKLGIASADNLPLTTSHFPKSPLSLTSHQEQALKIITHSIEQRTRDPILLYGVTGSGKTEVYMQAIAHALKKGLGAIVLVPEISLTPQLVGRFRDRFQDHIAVLHSDLTIKQRDTEWERIASGKARIILGTRSAIFAPVDNLGIVILDEEYEQTYKQEKNPRYHAREVALQLGVTVVLGSATPSIETYYKAQTGEYKLVSLPDRIDKRPLPPVELIDMREEKDRMLSEKLRKEIAETLSRGEKVILFINRRGYFTFSVCKECGFTMGCPRCSVSLVYHLDDQKLRCGHCGYEAEANMICPRCHNSSMGFFGIGTQKIEKEVAEAYHDAKIIRLDRDAVQKRGSHEKIFAAFAEGEANVLIGTQLVTKGLDVARVTLVGVVSADTSLNLPDFRAAERTFQQLTQVAGRAGRHNLPGKVIIQSLNTNHYALKHALNHDYDGFYKEEIEFRKALFYPPYSKLINIIISGRNEQKTKTTANNLKILITNHWPLTTILGPAQAAISKLRGQFRYQILIKSKEMESIKKAIFKILREAPLPPDIRINVDIDPMNLL